MEPASVLATVALAAATLLPSAQPNRPTITIILKNWVNKNAFPINIYSVSTSDANFMSPQGQKPLGQILPGQPCNISIPIDLESVYNSAIQSRLLRFRAQRDDPTCCVDLMLDYCQNKAFSHLPVPNFTVTLCRRFPGLPSNWVMIFKQCFDCTGNDEKEHLNFEIDGKILGHDMRHSRLSVQKIVKTKIE